MIIATASIWGRLPNTNNAMINTTLRIIDWITVLLLAYPSSMLLMAIMCLVLSAGTVPAMNAYAETVQTETVQTDAQNGAQTAETTDAAKEDEETFFFLMMGGGLLIIIFAVVAGMATVSSSIAVAANKDVDRE